MSTFGPPARANAEDLDRWEARLCIDCFDGEHGHCNGYAYGDRITCECPEPECEEPAGAGEPRSFHPDTRPTLTELTMLAMKD